MNTIKLTLSALIGLATLGTSLSANAERTWTHARRTADGTFYVDQLNAKRYGHKVQTWTAWVPAAPVRMQGHAVQRVEVLNSLDCAHRDVVYAQMHFYRADGKRVWRMASDKRAGIAPDSSGAIVLSALCG